MTRTPSVNALLLFRLCAGTRLPYVYSPQVGNRPRQGSSSDRIYIKQQDRRFEKESQSTTTNRVSLSSSLLVLLLLLMISSRKVSDRGKRLLSGDLESKPCSCSEVANTDDVTTGRCTTWSSYLGTILAEFRHEPRVTSKAVPTGVGCSA